MAELRYSELKFEGHTYTEQWKIDEILIKNKFNWMVNAEIKNARLEIFENTLVWNAGIWYNGSWYFGVWRDGEWRYGTWQNGVWYNGVWRDGTFKSGIIYKGKFFKGTIESGEIRGGQFIDMKIDPKVVEYTEDEYQIKKEKEQQAVQQAAVATTQPAPVPTNPDTVKVHSTPPAGQQPVSAQPKIQQEKLIIKFENFLYEAVKNPRRNYKIGDYVVLKEDGDDSEGSLIKSWFISDYTNKLKYHKVLKINCLIDKKLNSNDYIAGAYTVHGDYSWIFVNDDDIKRRATPEEILNFDKKREYSRKKAFGK